MALLGLLAAGLIGLVVAFCYIIAISFTLWMAIDAGKQDRFWWLVFVVGIPIIGPIAYFFTEKRHQYARVPAHHVHKTQTERQHENAPHTKEHHGTHPHKAHSAKAEEKNETQEVKETPSPEKKDEVSLEELVEGEEKASS